MTQRQNFLLLHVKIKHEKYLTCGVHIWAVLLVLQCWFKWNFFNLSLVYPDKNKTSSLIIQSQSTIQGAEERN